MRIDPPHNEYFETGKLVQTAHKEPTTTTTAVVGKPDPTRARLETLKLSLIATASSLTVTDQPSFEAAALARREIRQVTDTFTALLRPGIDRAHKTWKASLAELNEWVDGLTRADLGIKKLQDAHTNRLRAEQAREQERTRQLRQEAQERELAEEMEQASQANDEAAVIDVMERMTAPVPDIPVVVAKPQAVGASTSTVRKFNLLDVSKVRVGFLREAISHDIGKSGECEWLMKAIAREIKRSGLAAEQIVGDGAITYYEEASTGVRR